jgi:uncharacterized protein (DUF2252 family)
VKTTPAIPIGRRKHAKVLARFTAAMPSVVERMAAGKALRAEVPHESHAEYQPAPNRQDPVAILEVQAKTRLAALIPIRYARMLTSPFAFLRGSAAVMAADMARTPVTKLMVQACGDMHVANFGWFASAERSLIFGINDFDETLPGPWEWDLKRLATSAVVAGRFLGADKVLRGEAARAVVRSYRKHMREYAEMAALDVWYSRIDEEDILSALSRGARTDAQRIMAKARQVGHTQMLAKMAELVGDRHRIVEDPPFIVRETHTSDGHPIAESLGETLQLYLESLPDERRTLLARYRIMDVARKVVGVGSVGTRCWVILLTGTSPEDPLFLQYKEAQASVLAPYWKSRAWESEGKRVVVGQRTIQGAPDIFLGWGVQRTGVHFYMRQLRDMKGGVDFVPRGVANLPAYCKLCGWALALAHAKSGDPAAIAGYLGKSDAMDEAVARFAATYSGQTDRDYEALLKAANEKRIPWRKARSFSSNPTTK